MKELPVVCLLALLLIPSIGRTDRAEGDRGARGGHQEVQARHHLLQEARRLQGLLDPQLGQGVRRGPARSPLPHRPAARRARGHPQGDDQGRLPIHGDGPDRDDHRRARAAAHEEQPKTNWDKRARGLGGKLSSCGEENLLNLKGDRYSQENILIHEFNHAIHQQGLREVDPTFDGRLREAYKKAMDKGLWKGTYVATNPSEYWAEGAQAYFDCMRPQFGANTREKLQKYDPELFALVDEVYKQSKFRYVRYDKRDQEAGCGEPEKKTPDGTGRCHRGGLGNDFGTRAACGVILPFFAKSCNALNRLCRSQTQGSGVPHPGTDPMPKNTSIFLAMWEARYYLHRPD